MSHHAQLTQVFRAMKRDPDGKPLCGPKANELGLRPGVDLATDSAGHVQPKSGGLSVTPDDASRLPPHVRPASLGGKGKLPVFVLEVVSMSRGLTARRDPARPRQHAFIEPTDTMDLTAVQALLCADRNNWEVLT